MSWFQGIYLGSAVEFEASQGHFYSDDSDPVPRVDLVFLEPLDPEEPVKMVFRVPIDQIDKIEWVP